jgi:hypothetical protein
MLFIKTTRFTQVLATQFLNGIPIYLGDLSLRARGYSGTGTMIITLDTQLIRFTFSDSLSLPVNNEQLVIINSTSANWRITDYEVVDPDGIVYFRFAYIPPNTLNLNAGLSMDFEVGDVQLDV